jgi:hypothetical protein
MQIDGTSVFQQLDKEKLRRFLLECPYQQDFNSTSKIARIRGLLPTAALDQILAERAKSDLKTIAGWSPVTNKLDEADRLLGNMSFDDWKTYIDSSPAVDTARYALSRSPGCLTLSDEMSSGFRSIEKSNHELEESVKSAAIRYFKACGLKAEAVDSALSAAKSLGEISNLNKDITGMDDISYKRLEWSEEWWYPKMMWPNFVLPPYSHVAPPAMEASSPKKKVDIAEAMSGLAGAAERKNIFTWDVDWNAVCGSVVELQNAKEAAEKKKADEAARKQADEAARKQVSANKPPPSQVAPAAKPAEATIRPAVGSKHQFP